MTNTPKVHFPKEFQTNNINTPAEKRGNNDNGNDSGGGSMSDYIGRREFEQYEKRIDKHLTIVEEKVDELPNQISKDMKILLNDYDKKRRSGNWFVIGLTLTGVSIIVTVASIVIPLF